MTVPPRRTSQVLPGPLLVLFALGLFAADGAAAGLGFQNKVNFPIVVQGASLVNNMVRRGQPILVLPGRVGWDANLPPTARQVLIYDANQPNRVLFRDTVPFDGSDRLFTVEPSLGGGMPVLLRPVPNP